MTAAFAATSANAQVEYVATPAGGSTVPTLTNVTLEFTADNLDEVEVATKSDIVVNKDGELFSTTKISINGGIMIATLDTPATEAGEYEFFCPANNITIWSGGYSNSADNTEDISLKYTVEGQSSDFNFIATPADSSTVPTLTNVTLEFAADNLDEVEVATKSDIVVNKGGELFSTTKLSINGGIMIATLDTPATEAGEYEFFCPAGNITLWSGGYSNSVANTSDISLKYTVEGQSSDFKFTATPAGGSTVTSLETVTLEFAAENLDEVEIATKSDIVVNKGGELFSTTKVTVAGNKLTATLETPATEAGEYEFFCPAGNITLWSGGYSNSVANTIDISLKYTIEGAVVVVPEFEYTLNPASGSTVESLETIAISCDPDKAAIEVKDASGIKVLKDGEDFCGVTSEETKNSEVYTFTLATKATEAGTYELVIPAGAIDELVNNGDEIISNKEIRATYTIEAPKTPVVYDLEIVKCKPAEGEVDMDMIQFESIIVTVKDTGLGADPEATATLAAEDGSYTYTGQFKFSWGVQFIMFVTEAPKYNGKYTFTIPQGSFGDAEWMADHSTGHSNPEIVVDYTFTGLKDPASPVAFDIVPESYLPATDATVNDLATVTVNFSKYYNAFSEKAVAHLSCTEAHYEATATPSRTYGDSFSYTFDPAPTEAGNYLFVIEEGAFGDNDYAEDNTLGHASAAISVVYEFVPEGSGINAIFSEDNDSIIYSIDGKVIGKSVKNLPAGLYIREGKKIIVK